MRSQLSDLAPAEDSDCNAVSYLVLNQKKNIRMTHPMIDNPDTMFCPIEKIQEAVKKNLTQIETTSAEA